MKGNLAFFKDKFESRKLLIGLCVLHLVIILLYLGFYGIDLTSDACEYITIADNFLKTGRFLDASGFPIVFRTPGYPFYLAVIFFLTGHSYGAVVFLNVVMSECMLIMMYKVIRDNSCGLFGFLGGDFLDS